MNGTDVVDPAAYASISACAPKEKKASKAFLLTLFNARRGKF
jgi:hypothetical protein